MPVISVTVFINGLEYLEKVIEKMDEIKKITQILKISIFRKGEKNHVSRYNI